MSVPFAEVATTAGLLAAFDVPYLLATKRLHGRTLPLNAPVLQLVVGAAIVYIALAYGIVRTSDAVTIGLVSYAVYNGAVLATHARYPVWLAALDTAWGTGLCVGAWWVARRLLS